MFKFLNEEYSFSELFSGKYARFLKGGVITDSIAFKKWFGESKVVDDDGNPLIVYHGTTHTWTKYSPEKGNPNNFLGVGFYASSSKSDVERNYKGIGKDLTSRIESLADKLTDEEINDKKLPYEKRGEVYNKKRVVAKKLLVGKKQHILEVYLSMQNPLILTNTWKGTNFEFGDTYDEATEEYTPSEEREKLFDIVRGLVYGKYSEHNLELHKVLQPLDDIYDTIKANDLLQKFKENYYLLDWLCCSENGEPLNMNFIRDIFIEMGFDGIIDEMPSERFKGMDIPFGTKHYIVWNSTQIKSATDNNGKFDSNNPDIRYDIGGLFHGSPFDFCDTKFSLDKIGGTTEQGNMGWGIYFTNEMQIAEGYSQIPSERELISYEEAVKLSKNGERVIGKKREGNGTIVMPFDKIEDKTDYRWYREVESPNVYRVTLHKGKSPDQYDYMEYDLTDNQLEKIKRQAQKENIDLQLEDWRMDLVYNRLSEILGGDKYASLFLLRSGIDGIKYPCQMTDAPRVKNIGYCFNYVVFDAENISIDECIKLTKNV